MWVQVNSGSKGYNISIMRATVRCVSVHLLSDPRTSAAHAVVRRGERVRQAFPGNLGAYLGFGIHDGGHSIVVVPVPTNFPPTRLHCEGELAMVLDCRTGEVPPASLVRPTQIGVEGREVRGDRGSL